MTEKSAIKIFDDASSKCFFETTGIYFENKSMSCFQFSYKIQNKELYKSYSSSAAILVGQKEVWAKVAISYGITLAQSFM